MKYVDPLVVSVASLLQSLCSSFESAAFRLGPFPSLPTLLGGIVLSVGAFVVASAAASTEEVLDATPALGDAMSDVDTDTSSMSLVPSSSSSSAARSKDKAQRTAHAMAPARAQAQEQAPLTSSLLPPNSDSRGR